MILLAAETTAAGGGKPFHTPAAGELFNFAPLYDGAPQWLTFPMVVMTVMTLLIAVFFLRAFAKPKLVPTGAQNLAEASVDFVQQQIALPVLGPDSGRAWTPFLVTMFVWVFFLNIMGIIPGIQFPITSRMAIPATLAAISWVIYMAVGIKTHGFFGYFKFVMFPPGVPKAVKPFLAFIEFFSTIIVRPITLAVRLFANMVAGHMILAVLFIGTAVFFASGLGKATFVLPFVFATVMTGFEIFVAGMQAFIITILTAVYIAGAQAEHH